MTILEEIAGSEQLAELDTALSRRGKAAALFGVYKIQRALCAAAFAKRTGRKVILVCESDADAFKSAADMREFGLKRTEALPSREITLLDVESISHTEETERLSV